MSNTPIEKHIDAWSFHRLMDYEKCDYMCWLKHGEKVPEPETKDKTAANRGIKIHDEFCGYVKGERTEPTDDAKVLKHIDKFPLAEWREQYAADPTKFALEEQWGFDRDWQPTDYFGKDIWCRIVIDLFQWLDNELSAASVNDYKSGKRMGNEVKHAQQMQLYAVASFMKYASLQSVTVNLLYVDEGKTVTRTYTRKSVEFFISNYTRRGLKLTSARAFPPKPNKMNCLFCPYGPNNGGSGYCVYGVVA